MANTLYNSVVNGAMTGTPINWVSGDMRVMFVRSTYTFDANDQFIADIGAVDNGRSSTLANKTVTARVADADDTSLTATSAVPCNALIVFQHTGDDATARLIAYVDTVASGLPMTPAAGQNIPIAFDNGANRIFKL